MNDWLLAYLWVFGCATAFSLALTPLAKKLSFKVGLLDDPGERKIHREPTPLLGGAAVFTAFCATILVNALIIVALADGKAWLDPLIHGFLKRQEELLGMLLGGVLMLALGMVDDKHDMAARTKLVGQFGFATIAMVSGVKLKFFIPNEWLAGALTVFWIVTVTNSMNFFDNMDGLCGGVGMIAALTFGAVAAFQGQYLVCGLALAFAGALLGFLFFNFHPAKIFLGDSGSHFVGYMLAVLAVLPTFYRPGGPTRLTVLIPLLALGLPLFDACAVVFIRLKNRRPIYKGDTNHISHRLLRTGLSRPQTALILYGVQALLGAGAVSLLWIPAGLSWLVFAASALVLLGVSLYPHFAPRAAAP